MLKTKISNGAPTPLQSAVHPVQCDDLIPVVVDVVVLPLLVLRQFLVVIVDELPVVVVVVNDTPVLLLTRGVRRRFR